MNHEDLLSVLQNGETTFNWLKEKKLLHDYTGPCLRCKKGTMKVRRSGRCIFIPYESYRCSYKSCGYVLPITYNSWFTQSKLTIPKMLKMIYWWCHGMKSCDIMRETRIYGEAVTQWTKFCRMLCCTIREQDERRLGGESVTVELGHHKAGNYKEYIICGYERGTKEKFLEVLDDCSQETVVSVILRCILPGTTVVTNGSGLYECLAGLGYEHVVVTQVATSDGPSMNNVFSTWKQLKEKSWCKLNRSYLDEFLVRSKYMSCTEGKFAKFLELVARVFSKYPGESEAQECAEASAEDSSGVGQPAEGVDDSTVPSPKKIKLEPST